MISKIAKQWSLVHVFMIVVGCVIIIYFDPILDVTHSVLKMFISFVGMILIVVGNIGLAINILDHRRNKKRCNP